LVVIQDQKNFSIGFNLLGGIDDRSRKKSFPLLKVCDKTNNSFTSVTESVTIKLCRFRPIIVTQSNLAYQVIRPFTSVKIFTAVASKFFMETNKKSYF
jgi:hypothetical protein